MTKEEMTTSPIGSLLLAEERYSWALWMKVGEDMFEVISNQDDFPGARDSVMNLKFHIFTDVTSDFQKTNTISNTSDPECHCSFTNLGHDLNCEYVKSRKQYN